MNTDDKLKKILEVDLPRLNKRSKEYHFWWRVQVISLFAFVVLFVFGIVRDWWMLIPAFLCLALNLFANISRTKNLKKES